MKPPSMADYGRSIRRILAHGPSAMTEAEAIRFRGDFFRTLQRRPVKRLKKARQGRLAISSTHY